MRATRELWSPLAAALALTAAVIFFGGGSGTSTLPWVGGAAILAAAVFATTRGLPSGFAPLLPLAGLAVWCAVSIAWSIEPDRSWDYANRGAVYLAFALVGAFLAGRTRELAYGLAALLGAVCLWSLAGKVFPFIYGDYGRIARLRGPIGYWNALGLLGDIALPLGLWLATRRRSLGALLVYGWSIAIALTYSRGGIVVALLIVGAWFALSGFWLQGLATLVSASVPAAAVVGLAFALDGVTSDGTTHAARVHDGLLFGAGFLVGAAAVAALSRVPPPEPFPAVRRAAIALAIAVAVATCLTAGFHARSWWNDFTSPATSEVSQGPGRLGDTSSNHRWVWWKESWRGFQAHKLAGTGAGSFEFTNLRYRTTSLDASIEPHDLPVQFLSETGVIGLALFLLAGFGLIRGARGLTDPETALALALPAYLLHSLIDIDWDFAAVSAPVFLIAGALVAKPISRPRVSFANGLAAAGIAFAMLSSLFAVWLGNRWSGQAADALGSSPSKSVTLAKRARSVQPLSIDPLYYQALAEELLAVGKDRAEHLGNALGLLEEATRLQPDNAEAWYRLGEFNYRARNCPRTALPELDRFTALDPQNPGNVEYHSALLAVNSGKPIC